MLSKIIGSFLCEDDEDVTVEQRSRCLSVFMIQQSSALSVLSPRCAIQMIQPRGNHLIYTRGSKTRLRRDRSSHTLHSKNVNQTFSFQGERGPCFIFPFQAPWPFPSDKSSCKSHVYDRFLYIDRGTIPSLVRAFALACHMMESLDFVQHQLTPNPAGQH